jgi:hypothetical protein
MEMVGLDAVVEETKGAARGGAERTLDGTGELIAAE